jgi:hypothetical protein
MDLRLLLGGNHADELDWHATLSFYPDQVLMACRAGVRPGAQAAGSMRTASARKPSATRTRNDVRLVSKGIGTGATYAICG